jgi:hypothetical protein
MKRILIGIMLVLSLAGGSRAVEQPNLPTAFDMIMLAGADYKLDVFLKQPSGTALDITGYTYTAQFRSGPFPSGILFAQYSTVNYGATGGIAIKLSRAQTTALSGKTGVWDLKQMASGFVSYVLSGKAVVRPMVTQ